MTPAGALSAAGHHLARRLGAHSAAVAVTCTAGRTAIQRACPGQPDPIQITGADLSPAEDGSVEAAFAAVPGLCAADLRPARGQLTGPGKIRLMGGYQQAPVLDAYDLVVSVPRASATSQAGAGPL